FEGEPEREALGAAERGYGTVLGPLGIGGRVAVLVQRPVRRDRLPAVGMIVDAAHGDEAGGGVHYERFAARRDTDGDGVGADHGAPAAPGMHQGLAGGQGDDALPEG